MPNVLVVDDSIVDQRLIGGLLAKSTHLTIDYTDNGADAMERIKHHPPDLVLADLIMPGMDGLQLVASIATGHPQIPVVLITGKGSEEIAVQALKAGAASYVPKDLLAKLLLETVDLVLKISKEERTQEQLLDCMQRSECTFILNNDLKLIPPLINYLQRGVRAVGCCDSAESVRVCVALEEALNNALFHGNLELESALREHHTKYRELVERRCAINPYQGRQIHVNVTMTRVMSKFVIRDEGRGFNPEDLPDPTAPENLEKGHGRGLLLMRTFMDEVNFNSAGNEVTLIKLAQAASPAG